MQELFNPLACGGKLVLAAPGGEKDTQYLAHVMAAQGVTFAQFVPSQLDATLQVGVHACACSACQLTAPSHQTSIVCALDGKGMGGA